MSAPCLLCGHSVVERLLDIGSHPISNRFLVTADQESAQFPLVIAQCVRCGLVQAENPVDPRELPPPYDWITYSEPEGHLDEMVKGLTSGFLSGPASTVAGVSFKDDSTLARFARRGLATWRIDMESDLGIAAVRPGLGVETIQARLTEELADGIGRRRGFADMVVARHIFEHAYAPAHFLAALSRIVRPGAAIVLEVPDCSRAFERLDYTTLWEEHTMYFTPATLKRGLECSGFSVERLDVYPYPFESSIVAVVRHLGAPATGVPLEGDVERECQRARAFGEAFESTRHRVRAALERHRSRGKIAVFGAGHLAVTYMTAFGIADLVDCVIDDNQNKRGLHMPGSRLPILGSSELVTRSIGLCLLGLNPLGEAAVVARNTAFTDQGGQFASIFPASGRALTI